MPEKKTAAAFIEPMLLLRTEKLPEGPGWLVELKFDGYRALAIRDGGKVRLHSRNDKDFTSRYPAIVKALAAMPDRTVIDGEVVALDANGKPSFSLLQNYGSTGGSLHYFIFDVLILKGRDVMAETLVKRRELLEKHVFPKMSEPIRYSPILEGSLKDLIQSVKAQGLEGLVAKRGDSLYEPGRRSGAWQKMRVNRGQEFVIGGYTMGGSTFDALVFGYYEGGELIYTARTHNRFTPKLRAVGKSSERPAAGKGARFVRGGGRIFSGFEKILRSASLPARTVLGHGGEGRGGQAAAFPAGASCIHCGSSPPAVRFFLRWKPGSPRLQWRFFIPANGWLLIHAITTLTGTPRSPHTCPRATRHTWSGPLAG